MILKAYSLLDTKTGTYSQPFFLLHQGYAVRAVLDMANGNDNQIGRYPFDFRLVRIGEFDDNVGLLMGATHEDIGTVGALVQQYMNSVSTVPEADPSKMTSSEVIALREASRA